MNRAFFLLSAVLSGLYPGIAWPEIRAVASVGYYFAVAIRLDNPGCLIQNNAASYATSEAEAKKAALVACGSGCKSIVTFQAVN